MLSPPRLINVASTLHAIASESPWLVILSASAGDPPVGCFPLRPDVDRPHHRRRESRCRPLAPCRSCVPRRYWQGHEGAGEG